MAAGAQALPPVQDIGTFCATAPVSAFTDTGDTAFSRSVECVAAAGVATGGAGGGPLTQYVPAGVVTRGQMPPPSCG